MQTEAGVKPQLSSSQGGVCISVATLTTAIIIIKKLQIVQNTTARMFTNTDLSSFTRRYY